MKISDYTPYKLTISPNMNKRYSYINIIFRNTHGPFFILPNKFTKNLDWKEYVGNAHYYQIYAETKL